MENVIIIGSGPSGLTAALYNSRANLSPLVVSGNGAGGQLMTTTDVENYPGFPEGIKGPKLMAGMRQQAARFGTRFVDDDDVTATDFSKRPFKLTLESGKVLESRAVIVATGAAPKLMDIPSEKAYWQKGVATCAVCDGHFYKGKDVAIVGGGDSAIEEALYMAKLCPSVALIHRRDKLRASKIMQEHVLSNPKVQVVWDSAVDEVVGDGTHVSGVRLKNLKTGGLSERKLSAVFVAIGHIPTTSFVRGQIELDEQGYIVVKEGTRTSVSGVFAAGDCVDHVYRQAVTAAGMGCMAALDAERWLDANK
ncbi:MAG: thioredoxin-disulfide reductase [Planctomycetes bacterium]|nr:thioredoxin-disulfide reductase [Planctomycetota bacterium]